jgi:ketosteroid isomerase-like protein
MNDTDLTGVETEADSLELVRQSLEAFNERDVDGILETLSPNVEFLLLGGGFAAFFGERLHGRVGARRFFEAFFETFPEGPIEFDRVEPLEDGRVLTLARMTQVGAASGASAAIAWGQVYEFGAGLITRMENHYDPQEALRAVGLR